MTCPKTTEFHGETLAYIKTVDMNGRSVDIYRKDATSYFFENGDFIGTAEPYSSLEPLRAPVTRSEK